MCEIQGVACVKITHRQGLRHWYSCVWRHWYSLWRHWYWEWRPCAQCEVRKRGQHAIYLIWAPFPTKGGLPAPPYKKPSLPSWWGWHQHTARGSVHSGSHNVILGSSEVGLDVGGGPYPLSGEQQEGSEGNTFRQHWANVKHDGPTLSVCVSISDCHFLTSVVTLDTGLNIVFFYVISTYLLTRKYLHRHKAVTALWLCTAV